MRDIKAAMTADEWDREFQRRVGALPEWSRLVRPYSISVGHFALEGIKIEGNTLIDFGPPKTVALLPPAPPEG